MGHRRSWAGLILLAALLAAGALGGGLLRDRPAPASPPPAGSERPAPAQPGPPSSPGGTGSSPPSPQAPPVPGAPVLAPGQPAPDFELQDLDGRPVRLSDFRGRVVFLNFWASWCLPCRAEMPEIRRLVEEGPDDVVVLGVNTSDQAAPAKIKDFMARNGYRWPVVYDQGSRVGRLYRIVYLPTSFFIDPEGVIRARYIGPMELDRMKAYIEQARRGGAADPQPDAGSSRVNERPPTRTE